MKLKEYIDKNDIDCHALAYQLMISHGYLRNIINGLLKPSTRLSKLIELNTEGKVTATELLNEQRPLKKRCAMCGCYYKAKIKE